MSKLYVILDGFFQRRNGRPASNHLGYDRFAKRYLSVFDEVVIFTRIGNKENATAEAIDGPGVTVSEMRDTRDLKSFLMYLPVLFLHFFRLPRNASYILRVPGFITSLVWMVLVVRRIPFGVEVVGDPSDALGPGAFRHPLRPLLKAFLVGCMWAQCRTASATAYVTRHALQKRYPPARNRPTFNYTSLDLYAASFVSAPRKASSFNLNAPRLVNVGMMHKSLKAQDIALKALQQLRSSGINASLTFIGDGDYRKKFATMATEMGIDKHVTFAGLLPMGEKLFAEIDKADLFILPSRQEGLPRAMIEAMARALPCIATNVGGNHELLDAKHLVPVEDASALASKISAMLADAEELERQSARNLAIARQYKVAEVQAVRIKFYQKVCETALKT